MGLGSLYAAILQVLNLADLGFASAISAALYLPIAQNNYEKVNALLRLYDRIYKKIGFGIFLVGILVTPFVDFFISGSPPDDINIYILWGFYLARTVVGYMFFAYRVTLLSAVQRSDISSLIAALVRSIISIVQIILILELKNMYIYVALNGLYTIIYNSICAYICKKKYPLFQKSGDVDKEVAHQIKKNVFALALQKIGNTVSISLDSIIISAFLGLSTVAIYGNYNYCISGTVFFVSLMVTSITASIGNSVVTENVEKNYRDFKKIFLLHSWIIGWLCICFIALFEDFMLIWMGENLLLSNVVVIALAGRFYFEQIRRVVLNYKDALGLWSQDRWRPIVGCIVNLVLNIVTVKYFGVIGVALSTIISFVFVEIPWETFVLFKYYFNHSQIDYYSKLVKYGSFVLLNGAIVMGICEIIPYSGWVALTIKGLICLFISNFLFWLEYKKDSEFENAESLAVRAYRSLIKIK